MRLKAIKLKNFRSYINEVTIQVDNLTAIVGKNDAGKSTILEALEIFFNNELIKIETADAASGGTANDVCITCVFDDLPSTLTIDTRATTTLADEYLLNADNDLEIVKVYNCSLKTPTTSIFVKAVYPTDANYNDLHKLKNDDLKSRLTTLSIDPTGIDQRSNVQIRRAIWSSHSTLNRQPILVSLEEEDGKKVWAKLKDELPLYALFQSDRASKDEDSEVQDPMKLAVKEAISSVQAELDHIKSIVQTKAQEVAKRTLDKLKEMNPELAQDLTPNFKTEPKWEGLFKLSLTDDNQIPINKRGSGTRRLILINFFRAEAERKQAEKNARGVIYAIEEPETSQHPNNQKMLIEALIDLSTKQNCQVFVTTHVPNLAGLIPVDNIRFIKNDTTGKVVVNNCNETTLKEISNQLGVLPDKRIQLLLCVEGPTDVDFFINISKIYNAHDPTLPDLENDKRVAILPLGGSTLKQWVDNYYSQNLELPEVHIYDRDIATPPTYQAAVDSVNARTNGSWATLTNKREIENYIHPDAIQEVFNVTITFTDTCDVPNILSNQVNLDTTNAYFRLGSSRAKKVLNELATQRMTIARINTIDTTNEIENWLRQIANRLT
ncbi:MULTISPECIES: ATP-binding protein [Chryseobacterium]|uniref:Recombination protein F n=1 Tax=Chryseobacterium taihuense TaxID=1141221 RepID=A0A4U8W8D3_9FLAO|nr:MULTISPECIES: ATP-binding protein [Chryseobacterium]QQV04260.1 ATP-binding protein [Chryseobacterium sp. FDAARGOS 1104]VFB02372.1 recombination protein F [Chryseobacterium taihuense]